MRPPIRFSSSFLLDPATATDADGPDSHTCRRPADQPVTPFGLTWSAPYLRLATYRAANATLITKQQTIGLAGAGGGGLVASVDGIRFVVPVPSVYARPNPKYFGRRGGATWLNVIYRAKLQLMQHSG